MKNSAFRLFVPALVAVLFLSACSFGLVPASSRESAATVSIKLGSLSATSNSTSRAIVQGSGYLYLRTVGGPTGDSGPFYGPYSVSSGESFSTTDIPAGTYTFMALYYSANKLDETKTLSFNGGTYTFRQIMQMSDDVLMSKDNSISGTTFADLFGGEVSTGRTNEVTLAAGSTTALSATLIPVCGENNCICAGNSGYALPSTSTTVKTFYVISGISTAKGSTISCTMTPGASGTATIGTVMFYGFDGTPLSTPKSVGTITAATTITETVTGTDTTIDTTTANSYSAAYLYIEYQAADLTLSFDGSSSAVVSSLSCSFTGNSDWPNKTLYIEVYDSSLSSTTVSTTDPGYLGVGVITTDSEGNGSGVIYDYVTGNAMAPLAGHIYSYKAFFDNKSRYASYASAPAVLSSGILGSIEPNYNDQTASLASALTATSGENTLALSIESFTALTTATLYVASAASGTGSGLEPFDASAFADLSNLLSLFSDATGVNIVLTGNVDLASTLTLSGSNMTLSSLNSTGHTISYTNTAAYLDVQSPSFSTANVILDGSAATGRSTSAVIVASGASATLGPGTVIQNMTSDSSTMGAALTLGGTVTMTGSTIKTCTSGQSGGGVYVDTTDAIFTMQSGSSIVGCIASSHGGGVYMTAGAMTMESDSSITGCTATSYGGGIYANSSVTGFTLNTGASVTGNKAGTSGGVYVEYTGKVIADGVVTGNYLTDGTTVSNSN